MKLQARFEIVATEKEAAEFCDRENRAHPRRKSRAHYTEWRSSHDAPRMFIVWYYV